MMRWWFAIKQGWQQRVVLKSFLVEPAKRIYSLSEITARRLDEANIAILVLDFDGVLAPHDALVPTPEAHDWLTKLTQEIGEQRVAILTNKPRPERINYFTQHFPMIFLVHGVRKKPYPDGLHQIIDFKGVMPHRVLLVDDRLLTGMLATSLAYTQGWYFCRPRVNYCQHPFKELFFGVLRIAERWLVKLFS